MKSPAKNRIKKKKQTSGSRMIPLFGGIFVLYFVLQAINSFINGIDVVNATLITVDDMVTATGYFVRSEGVVDGTTSETVEHAVHNGEKVRRGTQLAVEYTDLRALETSREISALSEQIALLQSVVDSTSESLDTTKLDQMIHIQMQDAVDAMQEGGMSEVSAISAQLRQLVLKRAAGGQNAEALSDEISALQSQKNALQNDIGVLSTAITSPSDGFFSDTVDGYETILTPAILDGLTAETFEEKLETPLQKNTAALGKVVQGFSWYFTAIVPSESVADLKKGASVSLRFAQLSMDVPVSVYQITTSENSAKTLLVFKGNYINSEILTMRRQVVDIIRGSYSGIKIPKSAIHLKDNEMGVYTLNGSVSSFKTVNPIYEGDTYLVVEQSSSDENGIVVQDDVIIHARGLEDNKVVAT